MFHLHSHFSGVIDLLVSNLWGFLRGRPYFQTVNMFKVSQEVIQICHRVELCSSPDSLMEN